MDFAREREAANDLHDLKIAKMGIWTITDM
jgi:hypothetical protein